MKKHIIFFILIVAIISALFPLTLSAQQSGLINWQSNGDLNAFLYDDVDSITYS